MRYKGSMAPPGTTKKRLTVAVTGPTGEIGQAVVAALERSREVGTIVGMARRPFDPQARGWKKVSYRRGDVLDRSAVDGLVVPVVERVAERRGAKRRIGLVYPGSERPSEQRRADLSRLLTQRMALVEVVAHEQVAERQKDSTCDQEDAAIDQRQAHPNGARTNLHGQIVSRHLTDAFVRLFG